MKEYIKKIICIMLVASMSIFLIGCGDKDSDVEDSESGTSETEAVDDSEDSSEVTMDEVMDMQGSDEGDYDNGIYFDEEMDGAEITPQKKSTDDFVGSWEVTSGQSLYQFGNVDLKIEANGVWSGNISDENLLGKWKEQDDGIYLTSSLFNCRLVFTDNDVLVMQYDPEDGSGSVINAVLTKK